MFHALFTVLAATSAVVCFIHPKLRPNWRPQDNHENYRAHIGVYFVGLVMAALAFGLFVTTMWSARSVLSIFGGSLVMVSLLLWRFRDSGRSDVAIPQMHDIDIDSDTVVLAPRDLLTFNEVMAYISAFVAVVLLVDAAFH
jgi:hypothetical protein